MTALSVVMEDQGPSNWCWAALSAAVFVFRRNAPFRPCDAASAVLGASCCTAPNEHNVALELPRALAHLGLLAGVPVSGPLGLPALLREIDQRRCPVAARIVFANNGLVHYALIVGADVTRRVRTLDPAGPIAYDLSLGDMTNDYPGGGTWTESYLIV